MNHGPIRSHRVSGGYWLVTAYGPHAADRVSNGIYPPALVGALLELVFGCWLLIIVRRWYASAVAPRTRPAKGWWAIGWLVAAGAGLLWYLIMIQDHVAQMPPKLGSYFRLYFAAPPLWIVLISAVCLIATVRTDGAPAGAGRQPPSV